MGRTWHVSISIEMEISMFVKFKLNAFYDYRTCTTIPMQCTVSMYCEVYKCIYSTCPLGGALVHVKQCKHSRPLSATSCCSRAAHSTDTLAPRWSYPSEHPPFPAGTNCFPHSSLCYFMCTLSFFWKKKKKAFTLSTITFIILLSSAISGGFSSCLGANMDATRTTGRGTSLGRNRTELKGMAHILIFLKDLDLAEYRDSQT